MSNAVSSQTTHRYKLSQPGSSEYLTVSITIGQNSITSGLSITFSDSYQGRKLLAEIDLEIKKIKPETELTKISPQDLETLMSNKVFVMYSPQFEQISTVTYT